MFDIKPYKSFIKDLHKIKTNFSALFNDGDNDIFYTGINLYGNRILGVIMFEDDDNGFLRYIHLILTEEQFISYINKKVSLFELINTNESFFLVDKHYNGLEISANIATVEDVPTGFLPLTDSYCPSFIKGSSFSYGISLKGKIAEMHLAEPEELNSVNSNMYGFIKSATDFLSDLDLSRKIYVEALVAGSFKIKFKIEVSQKKNDLFNISIEKVNQYFNAFLIYIFEKLPNENVSIFKANKIDSPEFLELEGVLAELYQEHAVLPNAGIEQKLIDSMSYSIENLKGIEYGNGFDRLEISRYTNLTNDFPIASINSDYISSVENKFYKIESKEDTIDYDVSPRRYSIQVYQLNKETGNGAAYLNLNDSISKINLHLRGRDNYQNTIFTHNMDEKDSKIMEIFGIAKWVNEKVKEITFTFES